MKTADLYEEDFYLWTQAQAEALRAEAARRPRSNSVDWEHVIEEIEDMGKSDVRRAESLCVNILAHLYKLAWTRKAEPRGHWRAEARAFRGDLRRRLSPTTRALLQSSLDDLHLEAAEIARDRFEIDEPDAPADLALRWTLAQILGEAEDPLARK